MTNENKEQEPLVMPTDPKLPKHIDVEAIVVVVSDSNDNYDTAVVGYTCDTVHISGLKDKDGNDVYFESELYHLYDWAVKHDFTYVSKNVIIEMTI